jgi:hypothetical protein
MDRGEYLSDESWSGSHYQLSLELGPPGNDVLAVQALRALWSQSGIRGPWRDRSSLGEARDDAALTPEGMHLYGCFALDDAVEVGCTSNLIRDRDSDWLNLSIPVGMLGRRLPITYPLELETNPWTIAFDERLARIGAAIYGVTPFRLGLVGEEVSGACSATELTSEYCERGGFLVPPALWATLAPKRTPILLENELVYVPPRGYWMAYDA